MSQPSDTARHKKPLDGLSVALIWARRGIPVHPAVLSWEDESAGRIAKKPASDHGHKDASVDLDVVRDTFASAYLRYGPEDVVCALHTGPAGIVVLDPDRKGAGDGVAYLDGLGVPLSWVVDTPSGGEHRYFWKRDRTRAYGNEVPPAWKGLVDVRSDGGWVVAPGTTWRGQRWWPRTPWDASHVLALPLDVDGLLAPSEPNGHRALPYAAYVPSKHDARLHPDTVAAHAWLVENEGVRAQSTTFKDDGRPHGWLEVTRPGKGGGTSATLGSVGPADLYVFSTGWPDRPQGRSPVAVHAVDEDDAWDNGGLTAVQLDGMRLAPLRYLVPDVLTVGGICMLAGPPKSGKSMLALALACAVAQGGTALGRLPVSHGGAVLYVSLDDRSERRAQERLRMVAAGGPMPANLVIRLDDGLGRGAAAVNRLVGYLDRHPGVALVVLDTVEHVRPDRAGPGESAYTADVRFLAELRRVVDKHPTVSLLCLAHTRKGAAGAVADDPISAVSGTHGVTGGADHVLTLTGRHAASKRVLDVVSRDARFKQHVVAYHDALGWQLTDDDPEDPAVHLTVPDAAVYRAVAAFGENGATLADLEPECEDVPNIGQRLVRLSKPGGVLRKVSRGRYAV